MNKRFLFAFSAVAIAIPTVNVQAQHAAEAEKAPYRLTAVKTVAPPTIDGDMNQTDWIGPEWGAAAAITGFTDIGNHKYAPRQTRGYFTYDAEKLYFAFSSDIEAGTRPIANAVGRDSTVFSDDAIEFIISPFGEGQGEKPAVFQFIGNSTGVIYDAKNDDKSWNGNWHYAAKAYGTKWIGEGSIRWADLGVATPKDGDTWRLNFARDWQTPQAATVWGPSTNFTQIKNMAYVTFREKGTVAQVESLGKFTSGNVKFNVDLANIGGAAPDDITGTLTLGSAVTPVSATVQPNGKAKLEFKTSIPDKTTDSLLLNITSKTTGDTLWQGGLTFDKTDPVIVELHPIPSKGKVDVKIDISGVPERPAGATAKVAFMADNATRKVAEVAVNTFDENGRSFSELALGKLPVGDYIVLTSLYDGTNKINETRSHFHRLDDSWIGNKVGISDVILPGWTPIGVSGKNLSVWGRNFAFDNTLFPSQIVARSASLLSSPIRLEGSVNGKPIKWDNVTFKVIKKTPARVDFVTTATSGSLQVQNEAYLEYDGMFFFKMHLKPLGKPVKVDSLKLVIPFAAGRALFLNKDPGIFPEDYGGSRIPAGQGSVWKRPFAHFMWVGDHDRGLQWFAEDSVQWSIPENKKTLELTRKNNITEWGITFADSALDLSETRTIAFGLHPTPVKPLPKQSRMLSMASHQGQSPGIVWTDPGLNPYFGYPQATDPAYAKGRTDNFHQHGGRVIPYMCPVRLGELSPEWQFYGRDWAMPGVLNNYDTDVLEFSGGQMGACPSVPAFRDFMAWKNKEYLDQTGFDGLYYDFAWPYPCYNDGHNHPVGAYPILGFREMYKRLYTLCKLRNPNNLIVAHTSGGILMPMLSWADTTVPGEEIVSKMMQAREKPETKNTTDLADVIDLDYYLAFNMGRQFGNVPTYMQPVWCEYKHTGNFMLLTDSIGAWRYDPYLVQLYQDLGMGEDDVRFLPFWSNGKLAQTTFTEAPGGLKGEKYPNPLTSMYQRPGKFLMLAVTNWTKSDRKVNVKLDAAALKINLNDYVLADAFPRYPLFTAKDKFEVQVGARSFRIILLKKKVAGDKALPLGADIPSPEADMVAGRGYLRGDTGIKLFVGDATVNKNVALPQESRLAQTFTLKKPTKIQKLGLEFMEKAGQRQGKFMDLKIYQSDANGLPTAKLADPRAWGWYSSIPGNTDYKYFIFRESFVLPPGKYTFVLTKSPAKPTDHHHYEVQLWPQPYMPEEKSFVWTSATKRWEKADGVVGFGVYGFER